MEILTDPLSISWLLGRTHSIAGLAAFFVGCLTIFLAAFFAGFAAFFAGLAAFFVAFFLTTFLTFGLPAFFTLGFSFSPSLNFPDPLPDSLGLTMVPAASPLLMARRSWPAVLAASTLLLSTMYLRIAWREEPPFSCKDDMAEAIIALNGG